MDNEFKKLRNLMPILVVNTAAAKEHMPEVEQCIRLIKEHGRGILNTLPFKKIPQVILIKLFYHIMLWLNTFLTKTRVSAMLLPCKIVHRHKLDFAKHCKAQFGTYCKAHDKPVLTNTVVTWSTPVTVLGPTGNLQGGYKFFGLVTGKKIKQRNMTAYPMPDLVIMKVEQFGKGQHHPKCFFISQTGMQSYLSGATKLTSTQRRLSRRKWSCTPPLRRRSWAWFSTETSPFPQLRKKLNPKAVLKMPWCKTQTLSSSMPQEWTHQ
jgi:hypothetical protein